MKQILLYVTVFSFIMAGCTPKYDLDMGFSSPTEISGPSSIVLDVASTERIVLSWTGGEARDGSYVLFEVLFDTENGDFSNPFHIQAGDSGGAKKLTLTHSQMNIIAKDAGILPEQTGTLKWTVRTSKGGVMELFEPAKSITVTRAPGVATIPAKLFLYGSATENSGAGGQEFRLASSGVFEIFTTLPQNGSIYFRSTQDEGASNFFIDDDNKLREAAGETNMTAFTVPCKITLNFNDLSVSISEPLDQIKIIWGQTYLDIDEDHTDFVYEGGGIFRLSDILFKIPYRHPAWPAGQTVYDERYYFQALFGQDWWHWRRMPGISDGQPATDEPLAFYEIDTTAPWAAEQWNGAWKLQNSLHNKICDVVIYTNKEGMVVHQFENVH